MVQLSKCRDAAGDAAPHEDVSTLPAQQLPLLNPYGGFSPPVLV